MDRGPSEEERKEISKSIRKSIQSIKEKGFQREFRYTVLKNTDIAKALTESEVLILTILASKVDAGRESLGKKPLNCVVVENDWPEFEPTWNAIKDRMCKT